LENLNRNKENSAKMSKLNNSLRMLKLEFKALREKQREETKSVTNQHEQILRLEDKAKKL
jgi:hypothetical protein